jgi:outer membrane immunogenic protein
MSSSLKVFATAVGFLAAVSELAFGADLPVPPVTPAVPFIAPYSWTGLYIGLNVGYGGAKVTETLAGAFAGSTSAELPGALGGAQLGYNYQLGGVVMGFEADFDGSMATRSLTVPGIMSATAQIPWIGTLRGRLGYAFDRYLLYATAGGAANQFISTVNVAGIGTASTTFTHGAWTVGAGLEAAISHDFSVRVEYLYVDTGNINIAQVGAAPPPPFVNVTGRIEENIVRIGLNYRLPVAW